MKTERFLEDVNLYDIVFATKGSKTVLGFLNMSDGRKVGTLECTGVVLFNYHTFPDGDLPCYVGEVNHTVIPVNDIPDFLEHHCYRYTIVREGKSAPFMNQAHHIHIEGEVVIDIVCADVQFLS